MNEFQNDDDDIGDSYWKFWGVDLNSKPITSHTVRLSTREGVLG